MKFTLALKLVQKPDFLEYDNSLISRKMALFCIFLEHIETSAAVLLNTLNGKLCRKKTLSSEFPMVLTVKTLIQILDNLFEAS